MSYDPHYVHAWKTWQQLAILVKWSFLSFANNALWKLNTRICFDLQQISYVFLCLIQGLEYRYSNIDILKYLNCFQWFFEYRNTEIQAKPISVLYRNTEIQAKPISILYWNTEFKPSQFRYYTEIPKFKPSQFRFIRNWQHFTQSLAKRSHAHTDKLMYSTIHYTLNEYALQLTAHSVLRIDFAIICQWLFSRLFPHRSDTLQSMRCTGDKHSHWHIIAKSIRNTLCAVSCNAYSFSVYCILLYISVQIFLIFVR